MLRSLVSRARLRAERTPLPNTRLGFRPRRTLATTVKAFDREPTELDNITTLPNGLRVVSEALPGSFSGVGVYIEAGSRYESPGLRGVSHIMDRLAFKSTHTHTAEQMLERVEALGGNIQCASSRESMMYQAATFNAAVPDAVSLLAETIRDPLISQQEVNDQLQTAAFEIREIWAKPDLILPELIHTAAFNNNTLGNPLLCPKERLEHITPDTVREYREKLYRPERMVVAFAGVSDETAVQLAEKHFGTIPATAQDSPSPEILNRTSRSPSLSSETSYTTSSTATTTPPASPSISSTSSLSSTPESLSTLGSLFSSIKNAVSPSTDTPGSSQPSNTTATSSIASTSSISNPAAHYTGGFLCLPPAPAPANPAQPAFSHIHLAFEGLPIWSPDIYALATLQTLLGGGGSFSAGGPGKGMYSRLYTNVLNQYGWVESCIAFNHSYTDSGLFGISASCHPQRVATMLDVMCTELRALTGETGFRALTRVEVARAKNQLRSSLLMNLESRMVELEDLGRQVQVHGRKIPVRQMCDNIEALTPDDLARVATMVVCGAVKNLGNGSGAPTVVLQEADVPGLTRPLITWDSIQDTVYGWKLGRRES